MLITLRHLGRSRFTLLWDSDEPWRDNIIDRARWIVGAWSVGSMEGFGCICGWEAPTAKIWPSWFWFWWRWRQHVKACPVPRDQYGEMID